MKVSIEQIGLKTILGVSLIALSIIIYVIFQSTQIKYLIPLGAAFFGIGFHFSLSKIKSLQSMRKVLTFIVMATVVLGIFLVEGWDQKILNTSYGFALAKFTTQFAVFLLNVFNIHATQTNSSIMFPPDSKIPSIDVLPVCAGFLEYSIFIVAFGLMLIDIGGKTTKKKLVTIFALGTASVFVANMVRIVLLSYIAYAFGYDILEVAHTYAGFVIFLSLVAVFWWFSLRWITKKPQSQINQQDLA